VRQRGVTPCQGHKKWPRWHIWDRRIAFRQPKPVHGACPARLAEIREQLAAGETRAEELRKEILRREKQRIDEKELRRTNGVFR